MDELDFFLPWAGRVTRGCVACARPPHLDLSHEEVHPELLTYRETDYETLKFTGSELTSPFKIGLQLASREQIVRKSQNEGLPEVKKVRNGI